MSLRTMLFGRLLAHQLQQPKGLIGKLVGRAMGRQNKESNDWTISLLDIKPDDRVLEVGFGPGLAIQSAVQMASNGFVAGIDFSQAMLQQANKLNIVKIKEGRIELKNADVRAIPYNEDSFNKVFAVNVIYLWPDLPVVLKELKRVMKSGGILALYFASLDLVDKMGFRQSPLFTIHNPDKVADALNDAGFTRVWIETSILSNDTVNCVLAAK